ncbi:Fic family protein [Candidatus Palauibacter polyketidifaciens]|uniref:Fic family protein n=1 Tax=Candidatus Palauibacter polyketidifaciens TaxID=3056740 RepID=UPI00239209D1|nr:Fic family protein [Candidatus Palauibacter polyketidifaciens]MDE2719400.1 Fic family protein [Candidatus Palauibacter polyketidifaciens]
MTGDVIATIDALRADLDRLRPLPPEVTARVAQKIRLDSNYHSNAIEGNILTLGETRSLILHGLTAHGKPLRDHLDIEGHDAAFKTIEDAVKRGDALNGVFIRRLHEVLLREPYEMEALTPDGRRTKRLISVGQYKTAPNNVRTSTGEIHYYTPPEQVAAEMQDLIDWYRDQEDSGEHPIVVAATFHYRFVRIHPFDDGNGRLARLLMNMILIRHGYTVAIIETTNRDRYIQEIEHAAQANTLSQFIEFIASSCKYSLNLHLRAARGESIEDPHDIDKEIEIFRQTVRREAGENTPFDGRTYFDTVMLPLRRYCVKKLTAFTPDVFAKVIKAYGEVAGQGDDGKLFTHLWEDLEVDEFPIPMEVQYIRGRFEYIVSDFLTTETAVNVEVNGECRKDASRWEFVADFGPLSSRRTIEYDGSDLEELKKQFNDLLRWIMERTRGEFEQVRREAGRNEEAIEGDGAEGGGVAGLRGLIRRWFGGGVRST